MCATVPGHDDDGAIHHLRRLTSAGLLSVDRRGKWAYYSIDDGALEELRSWLS